MNGQDSQNGHAPSLKPGITIPMELQGKNLRILQVSITDIPAQTEAQRWQVGAALCMEAAKMCIEEMRKQLVGTEDKRIEIVSWPPQLP